MQTQAPYPYFLSSLTAFISLSSLSSLSLRSNSAGTCHSLASLCWMQSDLVSVSGRCLAFGPSLPSLHCRRKRSSRRLPSLLPRPLMLPPSCHPKPSPGRDHMVSSAPLPPPRPAPPRPSPRCTETNLSPPEPRCLTFLCSLHPAILPSSRS